ncbi:MAG TPA: hypothetical protein VKV20_13505 [Ktedonobacteraceae bacterium]|jgi:hypothetical protein|nr:hypothetical protein [Ktedonobacteraceae bacterium]
MQEKQYPQNSGPYANLSEEAKKKRLDAMVRIWQSDTEHRIESEGYRAFIKSTGLDEYRYSVWMRFPEWERSAVVGQVITLQRSQSGAPEDPVLFTSWRHDPLLRVMPDWKIHLPNENVFNISVRITPGSLGEGSRWAIVMPREIIPRYKPGWPTQQAWIAWTRSFDWLSVAVKFIRAILDTISD